MKQWIVELSEGCWISSFGRTLVKDNAKRYETRSGAYRALAHRLYLVGDGKHPNARVTSVDAPDAMEGRGA